MAGRKKDNEENALQYVKRILKYWPGSWALIVAFAAWFALPGKAAEFELEHSASLSELLDQILEFGSVTLCTQCAMRRSISVDDVLDGVRIAGAAVFVEEAIAPNTQALVY